METSAASPRKLGEELYARGWRQGAIFSAPSAIVSWNALPDGGPDQHFAPGQRQVKASEKLIVITQDCDIVAAIDEEPHMEALLCRVQKPDFATRVDRNSARYFVVDPTQRLVAEMKHRATFAKAALQDLTPEPWPSDEERHERFVRWLARRYDRPAIPDAMVEVFQKPVERVLQRLDETEPAVAAAFTRAVHEVRVNMPASETPPFHLAMVLLVKRDGLSAEEIDAILAVYGEIEQSLDANAVHLEPGPQVVTEEEISMAQYYATRPLFLEYHTYGGRESGGADPYGRA